MSVQEVSMLIEAFNANAQQLISFMSHFMTTLAFKIYRSEFDILARTNSDIIINMFVLYVLKYEEHIINDNDNFFLGYTDFNDVSNDDMMKIFEFRSIWFKLDEQNKDTVRAYMKLLCNIASVYRDLVQAKYL